MTPFFADTSHFVAVLSPRDLLHQAAMEYERLCGGVVTTEYVLVETANFFTQVGQRDRYVRLVATLRADPKTRIVAASPILFDRGLALFAARPDKEWSLTDCISFVVMADAGLTDALTADHHFTQAGFIALLA